MIGPAFKTWENTEFQRNRASDSPPIVVSIRKTLLFTLKIKYYNNYPSHQDPLPTIPVLWAVLTLQASPK